VVVVEHEASVMRAADQIVDIGPGHGATGGSIVFQGPYSKILRCKDSLTGQYLSHRRQIEIPERRPIKVKYFGHEPESGARDVPARSMSESSAGAGKPGPSCAFGHAASR